MNLGNDKCINVTRKKNNWKDMNEICYGENGYESTKSFCYLGSLINEHNNVPQEIKARGVTGERYYSLKEVMRSRTFVT